MTVVIQFLLPGITYNVPHTATDLAWNRNKSACPGTERCGGDGGMAGGRAGVGNISF